MTKFTKLKIGDDVASSGGRVWKKLSVQEESALFQFTISNDATVRTYYAKQGMTWDEWIASEYNTDNYFLEDSSVWGVDAFGHNGFVRTGDVYGPGVNSNDVITPQAYYYGNEPV